MVLADVCRMYAIVGKTLPYRLHVSPQRHAVGYASVRMGIGSGKNGRAGRPAYRLTGISIVITDALSRHGVQTGCVHGFVAIAAQHILSCAVCHK